jgi:1-pyrroline-5-carboxylate dehydrogenase
MFIHKNWKKTDLLEKMKV